jgi:hypothetical protein
MTIRDLNSLPMYAFFSGRSDFRLKHKSPSVLPLQLDSPHDWHGWDGEEGTDSRLDVIHAWLLEDLPGNRVRILTQENQNGAPARQMASTRPNPMINGHQDWLDGLVAIARASKT